MKKVNKLPGVCFTRESRLLASLTRGNLLNLEKGVTPRYGNQQGVSNLNNSMKIRANTKSSYWGPFMGPGETVWWRTLTSNISWDCPLKINSLFKCLKIKRHWDFCFYKCLFETPLIPAICIGKRIFQDVECVNYAKFENGKTMSAFCLSPGIL